jgi:transposase
VQEIIYLYLYKSFVSKKVNQMSQKLFGFNWKKKLNYAGEFIKKVHFNKEETRNKIVIYKKGIK